MMGWYGGGTANWIAMSLGMVVFWGIAIALVVWLIRSPGNGRGEEQTVFTQAGGPTAMRDSAADILKRRYAAGEIDREEYLQKRDEL